MVDIKENIIFNCEIEYSKCFSKIVETPNVIRFRDDEIKDMYYHNFTFVKSVNNLINIVNEEIKIRRLENCNYCNILISKPISETFLEEIEVEGEISKNGYYEFDKTKFNSLKSVNGCIIKKLDHEEMIKDLLATDLQYDGIRLGEDFCTRRCYRRSKVYLSAEGVDSYLCYHNGNMIGNCDLFINDGVAKIEDFLVLPRFQRQGYGTTILKHLINIALNKNCHTIYLLTSEDDTAKEMYLKSGFNKIGERYDIFFKL